jgi:hypothetical protein
MSWAARTEQRKDAVHFSDVQARGRRRLLIPVNATFETFSTETAAETMLSADAATIAAGTCERRDLRG